MQSTDELFDLVGLGFGPANVSIAGAIVEAWASPSSCPLKKVLFLERHTKFQWHPGMLLPDARMQISFMKDLATLRSPQSPITFLAYLHSQNRLISFINRGTTIPTRREYADYLSWAAGYVADHGVLVSYGAEVIGLDTDSEGIVNVISKDVATGQLSSRRTRNLIISPGGAGKIPHPLSSVDSPLLVHSAAYLLAVDSIFSSITSKGKPNLRIAVVGGGQSAAEVALNLRDRLSHVPASGRAHEVDIIIRKGALRPSDDSGFANEVFDPATTDSWYSIPSSNVRQLRRAEYKATNYSVVNPLTLETLYEAVYAQKVDSDIARRTNTTTSLDLPLLKIQTYSHIIGVDAPESATNHFTFTIQNIVSRDITTEKYDAVICATGYQRTLWVDLLKQSTVGKAFGLTPSCHADTCRLTSDHEVLSDSDTMTFDLPTSTSSSTVSTAPTSPALSAKEFASEQPHHIRITRGYRLLPAEGENLKSRIYLQGMEEATHGLSDTLLSVLGVRAGEVLADLCQEA